MNILLIIFYVVFAVGGSTLIKLGGAREVAALFTLPLVNLRVSLMLLAGVVFYGASFVLYIILLNRFNLSFISPVTVGAVYVLLMFTAILIFHEHFSLAKTIGCALILVGILLIILGSKNN